MSDPEHSEEEIVGTGRPEQSHDRPVLTESINTLTRLGRLEESVETIKYVLEFVKSTNWFILVVLFFGFLSLLTALITGIIQDFNSERTTQIEYIRVWYKTRDS